MLMALPVQRPHFGRTPPPTPPPKIRHSCLTKLTYSQGWEIGSVRHGAVHSCDSSWWGVLGGMEGGGTHPERCTLATITSSQQPSRSSRARGHLPSPFSLQPGNHPTWMILSSGWEVQPERILHKQTLLKHFFSSFSLPRTLVTFPHCRFVRPSTKSIQVLPLLWVFISLQGLRRHPKLTLNNVYAF